MPDTNYVKLQFHQGDDVEFPVTITSTGSPSTVDLTGATVQGSIRNDYESGVIASFTVDETDMANGQFSLKLSKTETTAFPVTGARRGFVFDVQVTYSSGIRHTIMYGILNVYREVTT